MLLGSPRNAFNRCGGSTPWWFAEAAISVAFCTASCAFTVNFCRFMLFLLDLKRIARSHIGRAVALVVCFAGWTKSVPGRVRVPE